MRLLRAAVFRFRLEVHIGDRPAELLEANRQHPEFFKPVQRNLTRYYPALLKGRLPASSPVRRPEEARTLGPDAAG